MHLRPPAPALLSPPSKSPQGPVAKALFSAEGEPAPRADRFERRGPGNPFVAAPAAGVSPPSPPPPPVPAPPYGKPPTSDASATKVHGMLSKWGGLSASEAKEVVALAKKDAKLPADESDPKKIHGALTNLYVRAGLSGDAARAAARDTAKVAAAGEGRVTPSYDKGKMPEGEAEANQVLAKSEGSVQKNADADKVWSKDAIQKDPSGFARDVTQLDGDAKTDNDRYGCVTTSTVTGALLSKPESVPDLAKKLNSPKGKSEFPGLQKPPYKAAVDRIATGSYSPRDVSLLSQGMNEEVQYGTQGMPLGREMALHGKLRNIGWTPPKMERTTYGADVGGENGRKSPHSNVVAGGTAYDPWPYPGSGGKATVLDAGAAAGHGKSIQHQYNSPRDNSALEKVTHDGNGGMTIERGVIDGKARNPPLKASYTYDEKNQVWVRDPKVTVSKADEPWLPKTVPVALSGRIGTKFETI